MLRFHSIAPQTAHPTQVDWQSHEIELGLGLDRHPQTELPKPQHALDPTVGSLRGLLSLALGSQAVDAVTDEVR